MSVVRQIISSRQSPNKSALYIIGDSTVRNGNRPQCGWGEKINEFLDTTQISISNQAMAGRSTRTFVKEKRWDRVLSTLKPGDFVIMQFGHNEGSKPDTSRGGYRGVLRGTGDETVELTWKDSTIETVHTYGWYLKKFVNDAKAKGAVPIVCSLIPRNNWKDNKVGRSSDSWGLWAKQVAEQEGAYFIDLNELVAAKYDEMGQAAVKLFFQADNTHTNNDGAKLNAEIVPKELKRINPAKIKKYLN